ncbi:MAG: hypothetical protein KAV18_03640, partial [Candidatus Omnitrophica bacterium]|nr:hypothetical protein [Candidatus Omnitrophota bacterium]
IYFYLSSPSTLLSLLGGKNLDWFSISEKWYLSLKEYYYLVKLSLRILINVIAVFHIRWIIDEILWWIGARKFKTK